MLRGGGGASALTYTWQNSRGQEGGGRIRQVTNAADSHVWSIRTPQSSWHLKNRKWNGYSNPTESHVTFSSMCVWRGGGSYKQTCRVCLWHLQKMFAMLKKKRGAIKWRVILESCCVCKVRPDRTLDAVCSYEIGANPQPSETLPTYVVLHILIGNTTAKKRGKKS